MSAEGVVMRPLRQLLCLGIGLGFLLLTPAAASAGAERFYVLAGTGAWTSSGDGRPASNASLMNPDDVAVTPDGGYLVAESVSHRIRKVFPDGTIETVAGTGEPSYFGDGGPAAEAGLKWPEAVAITPDGGYLIADSQNHVIRKVTPDGTISTLDLEQGARVPTINGGGPARGLAWPSRVEILPDGKLLVVDSADGWIVDAEGRMKPLSGPPVFRRGRTRAWSSLTPTVAS